MVLKRKTQERIFINGGQVVVTVVEVCNGAVRLGISAPRDVVVDREEVHRRRTEEGGYQC